MFSSKYDILLHGGVKMKIRLLSKLLGVTCSLSMIFASFTVNSACALIVYEPEMPESAKSLKKIK